MNHKKTATEGRKVINLRLPYVLYEEYVQLAKEYGISLHEMLMVGLNYFKNVDYSKSEYKA